MSTLKAADTARARAETLLKNAADRRASYMARVDSADEKIAAAEADMKAATEANDFDAYAAAKARRQSAADAREMASEGLQKVEAEPIISESEYKSLNDAIYAEAEELQKETQARLVKLSEEMLRVGQEYKATAHDATSVLQLLQRRVHADADLLPKDKWGSFPTSRLHGVRDRGGLIQWSKAGTQHVSYKRATGRDNSNVTHTEDEVIL